MDGRNYSIHREDCEALKIDESYRWMVEEQTTSFWALNMMVAFQSLPLRVQSFLISGVSIKWLKNTVFFLGWYGLKGMSEEVLLGVWERED